MDPKTSAEPSVSADKESERTKNATSVLVDKVDDENSSRKEQKTPSVSASASASNLDLGSTLTQGDETGTKTEESGNPASVEVDKDRKSSTHFKSSPGKRKMKVDWTPELHRQFVKAVEQLGVDKAVPSKILEIMGIDCLTRHNVASHLQKYRSHRKHLLAREAETASWRRRRQTCGTSGGVGKRDPDSWVVPTTGFPPVTPMPHYRPLHVWGHPSANQSLMYMWPQPTPTWVPVHQPSPPVLGDSSFWYYHHQDVPAQGMPYLLPHYPPTGFPSPPVQDITPTSMYRVDPGIPAASTAKMLHQPSYDFYLSKESVDRALGDVLSKPWLPLPLGLKPPSIDTVMVELHRQGISKIPPGLS